MNTNARDLPYGFASGPYRGHGTRQGGNFIVLAALLLSFVLALVLSTMGVVQSRVLDARISRNLIVARQAATSGINRMIADIKQARDLAAISTAFNGVDAIDPNVGEGDGGYSLAYNAEPLLDFRGNVLAEYDVVIDVQGRTDLLDRAVNITCYAYVPTKADYAAQSRDAVKADASVTVGVELNASAVFDYSYFINHWGWFFGNSILSNGSVRANGQFDFGNYRSIINGSPRYTASNGPNLLGYQDDNADGIVDGSDGGAYAGMAVVHAANIRGMGAMAKNQHEFLGGIKMPNLTDLGYYENKAKDAGSSISLGATKVVSEVLGDDAGEQQNLFLEGTAADPIVIDGPVVVHGSVIISGYVTGHGSIYSGGNVYIAKSVEYVNPPATRRPASNDQATVEQWRRDNSSRDALGLFATEHIVMGNYTESRWQSYVKGWVNHDLNKSNEDAGLDGIHNTKAGMDGILGTADDDVLEGDGVWTVERYSASDAAKGLIPPGKSVGDVVPGSGEDLDGDGKYDPTTSMSEFNIPAKLTSANWAGNVPAGNPPFSAVSTRYVDNIDASLYTNHTLAGFIASSSGDINFNGSIVSRNESIIYSVGSGHYLRMNHDERLTGRGGEAFGFHTPLTWEPLDLTDWEYERQLSGVDPSNPASILSLYLGASIP